MTDVLIRFLFLFSQLGDENVQLIIGSMLQLKRITMEEYPTLATDNTVENTRQALIFSKKLLPNLSKWLTTQYSQLTHNCATFVQGSNFVRYHCTHDEKISFVAETWHVVMSLVSPKLLLILQCFVHDFYLDSRTTNYCSVPL